MISESNPVHFYWPQNNHWHALEHFIVNLQIIRKEFLFRMFSENVILATASGKPS